MGNQASRLDRSSSSTTINDDPCLDNMRQWHSNKKDEPYKRQYPLPTIANDHNRIKPRKQSSPAAVASFNKGNRKSFTKFFNRQNKLNLPRNNSFIDTTQHNTLNTINTSTNTINNTTTTNTTINNDNNTTTNNIGTSSSSSIVCVPQYIHPLAPPPLEVESLARPSLESRGIIHSNRHSLNHSHLRLLSEQQQQAYRLTGKRKYNHVTGSNYLLPCDDEEIDRLHLQHFMIRFAIQG